MFEKIRNRLTLLFSILMMLFLFLFIASSYFILSFALYHDSKSAVQSLTAHEWEEHRHELIKWQKKSKKKRVKIDIKQHERAFYYVIDKDGQPFDGDEIFPELRQSILTRIKGWQPQPSEVRIEPFKLPDGKTLYIMLSGHSEYEGGQYIGAVYAGVDITQQHDVFERLMMILALLSIVFLVLSSLLGYYMASRAMKPIMRSFARQREFVADASHELRTPLSVIQSSLEVLESENQEGLSDFSRQLIVDLKDEVRMMTGLVGHLLTLARADSGVLQLRKETFDLAILSHQLARTFQTLLAKQAQLFELEVPDTLTVYADAERIKQLLYILLENASKYTPAGGRITLEVSEERKGKEHRVRLAVRDTGIGIAPEQQARIFDRFYRVDKVRSRRIGGTGLGLAIAEWIVQAHEGSIELESELGKGSTFTVFLPSNRKTG
ncbi:sensor histidine kinase [Aneurinibacillus aneurinilyticus]|uniref:histidine kinase n=1 Tax=Aneurinibacillus aneurinilyticus TaxID=1391 RepID=A0A848D507_ANEAE|nr:ATP-binding protein [Aneurinibacillus aneurinilyticus]NMF01333.1 cell wall metabolism sensor histidine kinase WalK [Aneurinibacillus aneurinilyticus]